MSFQEQLIDLQLKSSQFSPSNVLLSQKIYGDLVLAKKWKHVDYKPINDLDICVFIATEPESSQQLTILPIYQDKTQLSLQRMSEIFEILSPIE
ncbi:hypothetical protein MFLAVUS_008633 [Mucor flavus]|uniref:tRNA-splicing endonuclease subunit Sen15 domain-containing protein n=1 Tax=Mucor flavus TaxID=439312 RepID=A0ABP9Z7U0_9FUNG